MSVRDPSVTDAEAPWLKRYNIKRHVELVDLVLELGYSNAVATGLAGWVADKALGRPDRTAGPTRSRYRRILDELGPPPGEQTPRRLIESGAAA